MATSNAIFPNVGGGGGECGCASVQFDLQAGGFDTNANITTDTGESVFNPAGSHVSGTLIVNEGTQINVVVNSGSSLWDWSIVVTKDAVEINNTGATNESSGGENNFMFIIECGSVYIVTLISTQHS